MKGLLSLILDYFLRTSLTVEHFKIFDLACQVEIRDNSLVVAKNSYLRAGRLNCSKIERKSMYCTSAERSNRRFARIESGNYLH